MLAKKHRFHRRNHVRHVYKSGLTVRQQLFTAKFTVGKPTFPTRVAVVVSRKVDKRAVVRNRIRRRLYELMRLRIDQLPAGTSMVITVFSAGVANLPPKELEKALDTLLKQVLTVAQYRK